MRCTRSARIGYSSVVPTDVFLCLARLSEGPGCDLLRARLRDRAFDVTVAARDADCVLPAS